MNNKEYGVKLDVDISKFTSKLNTAKTYTDQVMEEIKNRIQEPMEEVGKASKSSFTGRLETVGELSAQLAKLTVDYANVVATEGKQSQSAIDLKEKIRALKQEIENEGQALEKIGDDLNDLFEDEQQATDGMKEFGNEVVKVKNKGQGITAIFARFGDDVSGGVKKGVSSIKRFTLSLLGIRGAYTILTRAVNSYMSQDKDMHTRLQANWIALGSILAPIVERLISLFQRLVAYINIFVKAFTGGKVDLLSKAMKVVEKNTKGTTKAVKSLNKELGTLDEIENLNFDQGGGDIDAGGGFDVSDALKEIENIKLNPQLEEMVRNLGEYTRNVIIPALKSVWDFINQNILPSVIVLTQAVIDGKLPWEDILFTIGLIKGGITGGLMTAIGLFIAKVIEANSEIAKMHRTEETLGDKRVNSITTARDNIKKYQALLDAGIKTDENGVDLKKKISQEIDRAQTEYEMFDKDLQDGINHTQEQRDEMHKMREEIEGITNEKWEINYDVRFTPVVDKRGWNDLIQQFSDFANKINPWAKKAWGSEYKGTHFAKGNVAYQPTMAEFGEYAGARSNPEITAPQNMMRETLFEALSDALPLIGNQGGDTVLYVNGRELARATYQDYQAEGNRLGNSSVAVRRIS